MNCHNCGTDIPAGESGCPTCGWDVDRDRPGPDDEPDYREWNAVDADRSVVAW